MKLTIKILFVLSSLYLFSCEKFLTVKPDQRLATITTIKDMQALLDDYAKMNNSDPAMGEVYGDNYLMSDDVYNARDEYDRNMYTFADQLVFKPKVNAWNSLYMQVNVANTVLQAVKEQDNTVKNIGELAHVKAQALFFRGKAFYHGLNVWAMPYQSTTASTLPGIPIRLTANFLSVSKRANIGEGYQQAIKDLKESIPALPRLAQTPVRPSKAAAYGMLSRLYLQMLAYEDAGKYADSALQINRELLNYNTLNATASFPVPKLNAEIIFEGRAETSSQIVQSRALIDPKLYELYVLNDLRKTVFFRKSGNDYLFKGNYEGNASFFNGITSAEMLLTKAECSIRAGKINEGLLELNILLQARFKTGTFVPYAQLSNPEALALVKLERRKELIFRCMRWLDIRRFNEEGDQIILKRQVGGSTYTLNPRSNGYALAIPEDVIELSGMPQNRR